MNSGSAARKHERLCAGALHEQLTPDVFTYLHLRLEEWTQDDKGIVGGAIQ